MKFKKSSFGGSSRLPLLVSSLALCSALMIPIAGCSNSGSSDEPVDLGYFKPSEELHDATINSLVSTDVYGRTFGEGDTTSSDRRVGMFYFIWHGEHINEIYDVTKLLNEAPDELWDLGSTVSKAGQFHYFDEPLYGYYCSDDPWVLTRHIELLTMSGIDYISFDLTNLSIYEKNVTAVLDMLLKFQNQGWNVPKVSSFLNGSYYGADHVSRITSFYNIFYCNSKYDSLWLRDDITGLPVVVIDRTTTYSGHNYYDELSDDIKDHITFRDARWPYSEAETEYDNASWLDWCYPQRVYHNSYGNYMSVSVAQHTGNSYGTGGTFGLSVNPLTKDDPRYNGNKGRGYDYEKGVNVSENTNKGTNLETQWYNAIHCEEQIDEVFVTGWNEWIAYKMPSSEIRGENEPENADEIADFCDTCNDEFSRDLEMTKDGYGDNFYLQNMRLTRQYKSYNNMHYYGSYASENLADLSWVNARTYLDFEGDAMARHFLRADKNNGVYYDNNTNRNDIVSTKVSSDDNNLYIQVETKDDIIVDQEATNNMNILLSVPGSTRTAKWEGYNFVVNRTPVGEGFGATTLEGVKTDGQFDFETVAAVSSYRKGNVLSVSIPLTQLGLEKGENFTVDLKVADGISDPSDIMNYYIDGDSAPIGRLNYRYNSKHN